MNNIHHDELTLCERKILRDSAGVYLLKNLIVINKFHYIFSPNNYNI